MGKSHKHQMLGEEIKKILSDMLIRGTLKHPVFQGKMISINSVDVSGDGSYATLYLTAMIYMTGQPASEKERKDIINAFEHSQGFIRTEIGKAVKIRHIPELRFRFDESLEYGAKMDKILDSLK